VDDDGQAVVELKARPGNVDAGDQVGDRRALERRSLRLPVRALRAPA
jgi:hypothetical protein